MKIATKTAPIRYVEKATNTGRSFDSMSGVLKDDSDSETPRYYLRSLKCKEHIFIYIFLNGG